MNKGYVYILRRSNDRYYIGSTNDVERRMQEHESGQAPATHALRPLSLVFFQEYDTLVVARQIEYKLKRLKSRMIIERIVKDGHITMDA